jgi:hypothetical protein
LPMWIVTPWNALPSTRRIARSTTPAGGGLPRQTHAARPLRCDLLPRCQVHQGGVDQCVGGLGRGAVSRSRPSRAL